MTALLSLHGSEHNLWAVKQLLADVPTEEGVKEIVSKGYLQKLWGALAYVIPVQRTEGSWGDCKANTALFKPFEGAQWTECSFLVSCRGVKSWVSFVEIWTVIPHILSRVTGLQTSLYTEIQLQKYGSHQIALSSLYIQDTMSVIHFSECFWALYRFKACVRNLLGLLFPFCHISFSNSFCLTLETVFLLQPSHLENIPQNKQNCWILPEWALLILTWQLSIHCVLSDLSSKKGRGVVVWGGIPK